MATSAFTAGALNVTNVVGGSPVKRDLQHTLAEAAEAGVRCYRMLDDICGLPGVPVHDVPVLPGASELADTLYNQLIGLSERIAELKQTIGQL